MTNSKTKIKESKLEIAFNIINYTLLFLFTFICIYPFWLVFINSIASDTDIANGMLLFPMHPTFITYAELFKNGNIPHAFLISVLRAVISTVLCVVLTSMFAYLVTQKDLFARKFIYRFAIVTMYVGGGLIPWYIVMRFYHLDNSFLLYVIPGVINIFFAILVKTYIESLPQSLEESAMIDGAGFFTLFFKIILPLSKPILATIAVYQAVGAWNTYLDNYLLVTDPNLQTIQIILFNYINQAGSLASSMKNAGAGNIQNMDPLSVITPESVRCATTIIATLPILLVYPFLQKNFVKGIMMGAVKG